MDELNRRYKTLTPQQPYVKIRHYCAFQERTHQEVKMKLHGYGVGWTDISEIVSKLIEEGFLNEERYAAAFVGGKFRIKQWGRKKIEMELKKKQVSDFNIRVALRDEIDPLEYEQTILKIIEKKWKSIKPESDSDFTKQAKTRAYLFQRGFESNLVGLVMKRFLEKRNKE
jgi:regulatory protein